MNCRPTEFATTDLDVPFWVAGIGLPGLPEVGCLETELIFGHCDNVIGLWVLSQICSTPCEATQEG